MEQLAPEILVFSGICELHWGIAGFAFLMVSASPIGPTSNPNGQAVPEIIAP
jgi:hypothetical protein